MNSWKDNVYFILVEPKEGGNIGASARAIKNMGFKNLVLINPKNFPSNEAVWLSANASDVLDNAVLYPSFKDSIMDKSLVAAASRRTGKRRGLIVDIKEGAKRIAETAQNNKTAIVFGRESRGLFNEEVDECGLLIRIPTSALDPSLNLSQAVLLCAYELSMTGHNAVSAKSSTHEEIDILLKRAEDILKLLEYIPRGDLNLQESIMRNLKHLSLRAGITEWELKMMHGILSRIEENITKKSDR